MLKPQATKILYEFIRSYWYLAAKALILALLVSVLESLTVLLTMPLIQTLVSNGEAVNHQFNNFHLLLSFYSQFPKSSQLTIILLSFLLLTLLKNAGLYFSSLTINDFQLKFGFSIRCMCAERFLRLELPFYSQSSLGELLSYINEQAQRSEVLASYVLEIIRDILVISALFILLVNLSLTLTVISAVSLAAVAFLLKHFISSVQMHGRQAAGSIEIFSTFITEVLSGIRVVKSFNAEGRELNRAQQLLHNRYQSELSAYQYNSAIAPLTETVGIATLLLLLAAGSKLQAASAQVTLPFLLTYTLALLRLLPRVSHLSSMRSQLSLVSGSLEAIQNFLSRTAGSSLSDGQHPYRELEVGLTFESVVFTFPTNSNPTLKGVNFLVRKGKTTAIVGPSGSGKSTLVDLVMRFYDPDSGSVRIDGIDLREMQLNSWRQAIAMVSQDTFLFHASVRENIAYGRLDATDLEIMEAAKQAYAYEFIQDLPEGFETIVGNRGTKLSGGQRQRIAIARAILRNPDILILDEATSALDLTSERIVQKAIEEVSCDRTVIVIAHRLSTIEKADSILVLQSGEVVEQGTHQELLAHQGQYWALYQSQVSLDESISQLSHSK